MISDPGRQRPAPGVLHEPGHPTIVFLTVHTTCRARWLGCHEAHAPLVDSWREADAWLVGDYLVMPDHIHLFCAQARAGFTIEQWIVFWKRRFRQRHGQEAWDFQSLGWHHRLRTVESYGEKRNYMQQNPVRAGLVEQPEDWPWQGRMHELWWRE